VSRVEQYRERYGITDSDRALGPEPRGGDLEQRRHHRVAQQAIERLSSGSAPSTSGASTGMNASARTTHSPDPPRGTQARRPRPDERQRGGHERQAG
jgi:hypothetical protein